MWKEGGRDEEREANLFKKLAETHRHHALFAAFVWGSRITGYVQSRNANSPCRSRDLYTLLQHHIRHLLIALAGTHGLVPHAIYRSIYHSAVPLDDKLRGVFFAEIDRGAADFLGSCQTFGHAVDDVDARGGAQFCGVGCHQANGPSAKDGDCFARLKIGEDEAVPGNVIRKGGIVREGLLERCYQPVGKMSARSAKDASCSVPEGRVRALKSA